MYEELKDFMESKGYSQQQIAAELDVSLPYVNAVLLGKKSLGKKGAKKWANLFGLSENYLLTGKGSPNAEDIGNDNTKEFRAVQSLKKGKPYYNVDFSLGFDLVINDQTANPDYLIDFPPYDDCDCYCNVHGNSMYPTISSGDIVALKVIADFRYLINGEIYGIITNNGLRTIKRVRDNGDTFILIADNPSIGEQSIPKSIVSRVFLVKGLIKQF